MTKRQKHPQMYRMPVQFGPSLGPRQTIAGHPFTGPDVPKTTTISVRFLSNREQLGALLPEGFQAGRRPVVTVQARYITEIPWLAGRGYNTLGLFFPATFLGERDNVSGQFLTVLWENLADPIITGREELGYAKLYADLPEPEVEEDQIRCSAGWMGFNFLDLHLRDLRPAAAGEGFDLSQDRGDGLLHYKYIPRTGRWGEADVAYATLTPADDPRRRIVEAWRGDGDAFFHRATWEELPTMFNIVNAFQALEMREPLGATVVKSVGAKDLSDQRILR